MASKIQLSLDTSKNKYEIYECKQNDDLTLYADIFENGISKDLTNSTIIINCTRSDETFVIQNTGITKTGNKFNAVLERDITRVPGLDKLEVVLIENGKQNTTFDFNILVKPSVIEGAVESENTVTILEELENKIIAAGQVKEETENLIANGGAATTGQIAEINASLEQKVSKESLLVEARSKRVQGENAKNDTKGTFDSANFAGQELGKNAPIGNVMHHYTDGIEFQIDNVGEDNNILILKNAYNPSRRPDKPSDFVGSGTFLECLKAVIGSTSLSMFRVDKDGNLIWNDKLDAVQFISNKNDDNKAVFSYKCYKEHKNLLEIINAGMWELTVKHENNQCVLQSGNKPTNGLKLDAQLGVLDLSSKGDINLNPTSKRVNFHAVTYIYEGTTYNRIVTTRSGASSGRPTSGQYVGMQYLDTSLGANGKVIWWNGTNWIDAMGTIV